MYGFVITCIWLSVGVDSSVLIHGLGYTKDIVDYWVWHCTPLVIKYPFIRRNPTGMSGAPEGVM